MSAFPIDYMGNEAPEGVEKFMERLRARAGIAADSCHKAAKPAISQCYALPRQLVYNAILHYRASLANLPDIPGLSGIMYPHQQDLTEILNMLRTTVPVELSRSLTE